MKLSALIAFLRVFQSTTQDTGLKRLISDIVAFLECAPADETVNSLFTNSNKNLMTSFMQSTAEASHADIGRLEQLLSSCLKAFEPMMKSAEKTSLAKFVSFLGLASNFSSNDNLELKAPDESVSFCQKLQNSGSDRVLFSSVVADLEKAKSEISLEEFNEISREYTGITRKAKSKKEAIERIERHFEVGAQNAARIAAISKIS